MQKIWGKSVWIGLLCGAVTLLLLLCGGALLLERGMLREASSPYIACGAALLAALTGGIAASAGEEKRLHRSMAMSLLLYALLWAAALLSGRPVALLPQGLRIAACLFCGAVAGALLAPQKTRKSSGRRVKISVRRRRVDIR